MTIKCKEAEHNFGPIKAWKLFPNTKGADFWLSRCQNPGCDAAVMRTIPDDVKPVAKGESFRTTKARS